jgi:hypothetical protein
MPEKFGDSDLTPHQARRFINTLSRHMDRHAYRKKGDDNRVHVTEPQDKSPPKEKYGDAWKLIYGIDQGMKHIEKGERLKSSADADFIFEASEDEIVYDESQWEEHYEEFGYGPYGKGLKIGRRLYFYEGRDFEFSADKTEEDEPSFNFTDYSKQ